MNRTSPSSSSFAPAVPARPPTRRAGVTLADVCVGLGVAALLLAAALSQVGRAGGESDKVRCASNLRNIAAQCVRYVDQDVRRTSRAFSRTYYDPAAPLDRTLKGNALTGRTPPDAPGFDVADPAGPVGANNVMASLYNMWRQTDAVRDLFLCPAGEATPAYAGRDPVAYANWPAPYAAYCGYSYNCPFPSAQAAAAGWTFDPSGGPEAPLAADLNPGGTGPTAAGYQDGRSALRPANSPNHGFDGQNVAYCDQHVEWQTTPFAGRSRPQAAGRDNIYASAAGANLTGDGTGGAVWEKPADKYDAVLLPTAADSPGTAIAARTPSALSVGAAMAAADDLGPAGWAAVGAGVVAVAGAIVWLARRRRRSAGPPPVPPPPPSASAA